MLNTTSYFDCKLTPVEQADAKANAANRALSPEDKAVRRRFLEDSKEKHFQLTAAAEQSMKGFVDTPAGMQYKQAFAVTGTTFIGLSSDWF